MDANESTGSIQTGMPSRAAGVFATRVPAAVTLAMGVILFLFPFFEVAFANIFKMQNSGLGIAAGTDWTFSGIFGTIPGGSLHLEHVGKYGPNLYAIIAWILGTAAFTLSLFNLRKVQQVAMIFSIFTAALLIGCWLDLRQSTHIPSSNSTEPFIFNIRFQPTPWFYVAVTAFLVGAFFCYKRIELSKQ